MIPFATALVGKTIFKKVIGEKASKAIVGAAWIIGLIAAVLLLVKCHDGRVIKDFTANQRADTAIADRKADAHAAEQRRVDDARAVTETQEIKEAVNEAGTDPAARRAAYYECLRRQQAARRGHKPPAEC